MRKSPRNPGRNGSLPLLVIAGSLALGSACTPPPEPAKPPPPPPKPTVTAPAPTAAPTVDELASPPASGPARALTLPAPSWQTLANGLQVATIASHALPVVQIRVVALAGSADDGDKPGLASITGDLLKDGGAGDMSSRELLERVEALGATLDVTTGFDRTTLSIGVTKDQFAEAMELLATVALKPKMKESELTKLRKRKIDDAADLARTDGMWSASMMLYRNLLAGSPYAAYDATSDDLAKIGPGDCKAFHKKLFVPKNMFVVVAGDVTADEVNAAVEKDFGSASGGEAPARTTSALIPPASLTITLVDRPKSTQSDVLAGVLGPYRTAAAWPAFTAANQVLGGGVAGRLFLEVRERSSLAYRTNSSVTELAHGPSLLVAYAGTQSPKTGLAVKAVLDQLDRLGSSEPSAQETATATRFLSDVTAIRLETVGALATELVRTKTLGLPDDYATAYSKQIREVSAEAVAKTAALHAHATNAVLVVAGDAKVVGPMLSHFGDVKVVNPMKGFSTTETIAKNAEAPLELPEAAPAPSAPNGGAPGK